MNDMYNKLRLLLGSDAVAPYDPGHGARAGAAEAIVLPDSVDMLRKLVLAAPGLGVALAVSPNASGIGAQVGTSERRTVLVDLSRMNAIIEVDVDNGYALLEPGVSYEALHAHLQARGLGLWIDCERNALASVAGSIARRGSGYTPYGDHLLMQCGMEVMLTSGELVRTGMGAMPGSNTWQLFKYGYGPYIDGLFTQGNFGIITKIGVWLMPAPPAYRPFMVSLPDDAALAAAMELLRPLRVNQIVPNTVVVSHALMDLAPFARRADFLAGGQLDVEAARARHGLGLWSVYGALYGLPGNVEATWEMLQPALASLPGARISTDLDEPAPSPWYHRERAMRGLPDSALSRLDGWAGPGALWLRATAPIDGDDARAMAGLAAQALAAEGFDPLLEFELGWRSATLHAHLGFDPAAGDADRARRAATAAIAALQAAGYPVSDCSPELLPAAGQARQGSGLATLNARLRDILDPAGVLVPRDDDQA